MAAPLNRARPFFVVCRIKSVFLQAGVAEAQLIRAGQKNGPETCVSGPSNQDRRVSVSSVPGENQAAPPVRRWRRRETTIIAAPAISKAQLAGSGTAEAYICAVVKA